LAVGDRSRPSAKFHNSTCHSAEVEAELNNKFETYDFQGTPLTDVLDYTHNRHSVLQFHLDGPALKDAGIDATTTLVTIDL
jgi:hypothetical protein